MADIAASVLAKLKNKAKASGISYQQCLQLFFQEEFLRRLAGSKYAENFVLKGGLFIYSLTDFDSRVTVDVDFLLKKIPNTPDHLTTVIEEIINTPTGNDFITFEIKDVAPIALAICKKLKTNPVPFIIYDNFYSDGYTVKEDKGQFGLSNVAATTVRMLGYEVPTMWDESVIE